jgi:6-phosphofructokinase 1
VIAAVAHSGGPTAVINASLLGIVEEARRHHGLSVVGAHFGIDGLVAGDFIDLSSIDAARLEAVSRSSASAIGSSRRVVTDADLGRVLEVCRRRRIDVLFYTGGNGSMETAHQIAALARQGASPLRIIGVPKTIDNDLAETDHAPGYPSAARFFASAARDIAADNRSLPGIVEFVEVLGRNAGWIAAATALAQRGPDHGPHLIYVPERPLALQRLLDDVQRVFDRVGRCVVVVCEGQLDDRGEPFGADVQMSSRGPLARNLGHRLSRLVMDQLGLKARAEKPGLFGRSSAALRSDVDWQEARLCGQAAVRAAVGGASQVMVTLERQAGSDYSVTTGLTALERVAGIERLFPSEWIGADGCSITAGFIDYVAPIIGPLDRSEWLGSPRT